MTFWGKIFVVAIEILHASSPILVAIIAAGSAWLIKVYDTKAKLKTEIKVLQKENLDLSTGILVDLELFNSILHKINNIFNQSKVDRVLILTAMNGKDHLRRATCVYEQINLSGNVKAKLSLGATGRFINFVFDDAYRSMLTRIEKYGHHEKYVVSEMEDCDLKRIYLSEKITESHIYFLKRVKIDEDNDRVFYISYATHHEDLIKSQDELTIRLYNEQIKEIFNQI